MKVSKGYLQGLAGLMKIKIGKGESRTVAMVPEGSQRLWEVHKMVKDGS